MTRGKLNEPDLNWDSNLAYISGVLFGDGSIDKQGHIRLEVTSKTFAEAFYESLSKLRLNPSIKRKFTKSSWSKAGGSWLWRVTATSKVFKEWFQKLTIKDFERFLGNPTFIRAFIRGFYESEGSISSYQKFSPKGKPWGERTIKVKFVNANKELIKFVQILLSKIGLRFHLYSDERQYKGRTYVEYHLETAGKNAGKVLREWNPCIKLRAEAGL